MYGKRFRIRRHRYRKQYIASSWTLCSCVRNEDTAACVRTYPTCMCHGLRVKVAKCLLYLDILARWTETMNCVNKRNHHCSHCSIERYKNKDLLQRESCCCFARSFGDVLSTLRCSDAVTSAGPRATPALNWSNGTAVNTAILYHEQDLKSKIEFNRWYLGKRWKWQTFNLCRTPITRSSVNLGLQI